MSGEITIGRVRGGERDGQIFIGARTTDYDELRGGFSDEPMHAIILGSEAETQMVIQLLGDEIGEA